MRYTKILAVAAALLSSAAGAVVIQQDSEYGPGTVTLDTTSGLQWLDLNFTQRVPWAQVVDELQSGGTYEGFRFALSSEVESLAAHAGAVLPSVFPRPENTVSISSLINLLGQTFLDSANNSYSCGVLSAESGLIISGSILLRTTACLVLSPAGGQVIPFYDNQSSIEVREFTGSWLVRAVPEPHSYLLLLGGLLALHFRRIAIQDRSAHALRDQVVEAHRDAIRWTMTQYEDDNPY